VRGDDRPAAAATIVSPGARIIGEQHLCMSTSKRLALVASERSDRRSLPKILGKGESQVATPKTHPSSEHHLNAAAHHENAAHHRREAAHHHGHGRHEAAEEHSTAAHHHSSMAHEHTGKAHQLSKG
jgi:hypothetical protein